MWQITFVEDKPSSTGKTFRVLLQHPDYERGVALYSYIPVHMTPRKWDVISAEVVKVHDLETEWSNEATGESGTYKTPQRRVSFFGEEVALLNGPELPATKWVDRRTQAPTVAVVTDDADLLG